ncbi:MAG: SusE domain-containing protein [Bacteroidota bacterium]
MKNIIKISLLAVMFAGILYGCKKVEVQTVLKDGVPSTLSASQATLVLTSANAADTVEAFTWTPAQYGFSAAVRYSLQIAKAGTSFAAPKEVSMGSGSVQKYAGIDFNQMSILLGLAPGSAGQLEVRVKSSISDSIPAIYSNVVAVSVTPYLVVINYPSLWVPGDYQGWDPATAPKISSKADNGVYEGYVYMLASSTKQFKYTSDPDWNHTIYGWASSTTSGNNVTGTMNTTGGNLFTPVGGYYLMKANKTTNTWSATLTTWGLIGDAVPVTGWNSDLNMVFDATAKTWSVTTNLGVGAIKFRANADWALNFGDNGADQVMEYDGANINVTVAGNYTVTLDLRAPWNYTYKLKKN